MSKVYCVNICYDGVGLYGRVNGEAPLRIYQNFNKAVSEAAEFVEDILYSKLDTCVIPEQLHWTKTVHGGEWSFHQEYVTGYVNVICTITAETLR